MTPVLVDSNIIIDIAEADPHWHAWSATTLGQLADHVVLVINPIIYAEVSVGFTSPQELEAVIGTDIFRREPLPWDAAFLAGRCFQLYRRRGGARRSPLPDFFIGAHAAVLGYRLLTRDPARYRSYFPTVQLIAP
jgi:hypothetical protein